MTRVLGASPTGVCPQCGVTFSRIDKDGRLLPHKMYCGIQCQRVAIRERNRQKRPVYICQHCGKPFQPKASDRTKYCSRECAFAQWGKESADRQPTQIAIGYCEICGKAFKAMKRRRRCGAKECSAEHARRYLAERDIRNHTPRSCTCKVCGAAFTPAYGDKSRAYCSVLCKHIADRRRDNDRGKTHRGRARHYGCVYEPVSATLIFNRDGWRCRSCGVKTPQRLRGTLKPNAPELDHIIPLSAGGAHTERNLQCLCRSCNIAKGAAGHGQLVLV